MHNLFMGTVGEFHILNSIGSMTVSDDDPPDGAELNTLDHLKDDLDIYHFGIDGIKKCARCETPAYNVNMKRCSKCKKVYYCDQICQKGHKRIHKRVCAKAN